MATDTDPNTDMYEQAYWGVQAVLDETLGSGSDAGAGMGIVADVALIAQRYADLKAAVLDDTDWPQLWQQKIGEIEAADLREPDVDHTAVATETLEGCERCEQPIQAGERYVPPLPGIGLVEHVDCPTTSA